jgi:hypothetical protein
MSPKAELLRPASAADARTQRYPNCAGLVKAARQLVARTSAESQFQW